MFHSRSVVLASSITAAIAASLCCIVPVATALLGLTGFAAAAAFQQWRPYLLVLTGALLAGGFVLYFRDSKRACAPGNECAVVPMGRWSLIVLATATISVIGFAAFPYFSGQIIQAASASSEAKAPKTTAIVTTTLLIEGMTCKACATGLQATLERLPGITKAVVDYEGHKATITFDPAKQDRKALAKVVSESGYRVKD